MSQASRSRAAKRISRATAPNPALTAPISTGSGGASAVAVLPSGGSPALSFAQTDPARNYVPPVSRWEKARLTGYDLRQVWAAADRLGTDCPYAYGPMRSVEDYLGPITPRPATRDAEWNSIVNDWFRKEYWDLGLMDASRKFTPAGWQNQFGFYASLHGDALSVATDDEAGIPCLRIVPAPGIDSPAGTYGALNPEWQDGVRLGAHHRHLAWHVLKNESAPLRLTTFDRAGFIVPEANGFLLANWLGVGNTRGFSRLIPTGTTVQEMQSWDNNTHDLFKLASKIGMSLETEAGQPGPVGLRTIEGRGIKSTVQSDQAATSTTQVEIARYQEQFLGGGPAVITPAPGQKVNLHNLDRELPDISAMRGNDLERIAMCYGLPVQILFCIMSGVFNVTGPNVRLALGRAKTWRDQELKKREPIISRAYVRAIQWGIDTKQIPRPKKDHRFWVHELNYAKNYTIDEARDVNSDFKRLSMGVTTQKELAEEYGRDAKQVIEEQVEWIDTIYRALEAKKLPTTLHFPNWVPPWQPTAPAKPEKPAAE